jgi:EmrB/QacA subfamily drug resistance transporter
VYSYVNPYRLEASLTTTTRDRPAVNARRPWTVLAVLAVAQFMVILDITIVNVALPSIGRSLSFSRSGLQWVVTAYVLCSGGLVLVGGRAADLFGRRRVFLLGLALFTAASLLSAFAPSPAVLIASRAAQGVGAAMLTPSALSIVSTSYSGPQLATALSIWGAIASAGIALGVIFGGVLTTLLSWHWVFLVNVPVGVVAGLVAPVVIPALPPARARRSLDPFGALSLVGGLGVLVYALSGVAAHGWGSARTVGLLALAAALLVAFAAIERAVAEPLIPPVIWKVTQVVSGAAIMLGATGILAGTFFLVSVHTQDVLGWSALHSGLAFLPFVAATALGVHGTSHAIGKVGSRALIATGLAIAALGALVLATVPHHASYVSALLPGLVILGLGMGLAFPATSITVMNDVDHDTAGLASGVMSTAHEVGAALGTAVLSAIAVGSSSAGLSGSAFVAAAVIAGVLALAAAAVVPVVRPLPGARVSAH